MVVVKKKKKGNNKRDVLHATVNRKVFLAPDSIRSMSAIFTKIYEDGTAIIRISDCHQSIKLWNNLNNRSEVLEMLQKIETLQEMLSEFHKEVKIKLPGYNA